jgi:hypothetical protein
LEANVKQRVCDLEDGKIAVTAINWKGSRGTVQSDLCAEHMSMLAKNGHAPKRGRQAGTTIAGVTSPKRKSTNGRRKRKSTRKKTAPRKRTTSRRKTAAATS